jgi:hypothetical protein
MHYPFRCLPLGNCRRMIHLSRQNEGETSTGRLSREMGQNEKRLAELLSLLT